MSHTLNSRWADGEYSGTRYGVRIFNWDDGPYTIEVHVPGLPTREDNDHSWDDLNDAIEAGHALARSLISS